MLGKVVAMMAAESHLPGDVSGSLFSSGKAPWNLPRASELPVTWDSVLLMGFPMLLKLLVSGLSFEYRASRRQK